MQSSPTSEGFLNPDVIVGQFGIVPGMQIADFGSGSGHIAILIAQRIGLEGKLTALDILEDKLDSVRVRAKEAGLANVEMVRANLEVAGSSGLSDQSQDLAVLINILFQSQKKAGIVREATRVLKPSGSLAVVEWKKGAGGLSSQAGLGPPDDLRSDEVVLRALCESEGLTLERMFDAGQYHVGLMFKK